ncbi:hypothetical protein PAMA_018008 [Pampus argenteus]
MRALLLLTLALVVTASEKSNDTAAEETLGIARGSQCGRMRHKENARAPSFSYGAMGFVVSFCAFYVPQTFCHNLEYDSSEEKNPRLIFYNEKDEVVKVYDDHRNSSVSCLVTSVRCPHDRQSGSLVTSKMKADEISSLLDSLGFYKRSQKGEEVPEEFQHFPMRAPRDEL